MGCDELCASSSWTRFGPNRPAADMRELEDLIFWWFMRMFGDFLRLSADFRDQYNLQTASEVRSDLRFEICGPNVIWYHLCFACLGLCSFVEEKKKIKKDESASTRPAGFAAGKNGWQQKIFAFHFISFDWNFIGMWWGRCEPRNIDYSWQTGQKLGFSLFLPDIATCWVYFPDGASLSCHLSFSPLSLFSSSFSLSLSIYLFCFFIEKWFHTSPAKVISLFLHFCIQIFVKIKWIEHYQRRESDPSV